MGSSLEVLNQFTPSEREFIERYYSKTYRIIFEALKSSGLIPYSSTPSDDLKKAMLEKALATLEAGTSYGSIALQRQAFERIIQDFESSLVNSDTGILLTRAELPQSYSGFSNVQLYQLYEQCETKIVQAQEETDREQKNPICILKMLAPTLNEHQLATVTQLGFHKELETLIKLESNASKKASSNHRLDLSDLTTIRESYGLTKPLTKPAPSNDDIPEILDLKKIRILKACAIFTLSFVSTFLGGTKLPSLVASLGGVMSLSPLAGLIVGALIGLLLHKPLLHFIDFISQMKTLSHEPKPSLQTPKSFQITKKETKQPGPQLARYQPTTYMKLEDLAAQNDTYSQRFHLKP